MKSKLAALVYPHQQWESNPAVSRSDVIFLVEYPLFFSQYHFHCQKLVLHRASMTEFAEHCERLGKQVFRIESHEIANSSDIGSILQKKKVKQVLAIDPTDDWLKTRVIQGCGSAGISIEWLDDPAFLTPIERLMVLGNFMLLCDIAPNAVYQWFMEMFIDSYDWVMVPNVYGMSQHADGGLMTTKPYISGSSYVCKMSDYPKGPWCEIWDALYWRFVDRERKFFSENPRMRVMVGQLDRRGKKLDHHRAVAERYLETLHA